MIRVGIVDCGIGNLTSVVNAFAYLDIAARTVGDASALARCSHLVLPGVGSFPAGMARLDGTGLTEALHREAGRGKPLLGLCLGMQLLAEEGEEFERLAGLGLLPGRVTRLQPAEPELRLPHVGWNEVHFVRPSRLAAGLDDGTAFYFVHGYGYDDPQGPAVVACCYYGGPVVATVERDNVFGVQFHPEKSQNAGLSLLRNFAALC